jgi:exodeoxyribonuclease VII large subunit
MSETFDPETGELSPGTNAPPFSVSEISGALKKTIESAFGFVRVRGEISQPKVATSGHCYLRLKDENAVIDAIIWRGAYAKLGLKPEEGMEVIASGRVTTYPGRSSYQIIIESMELAGQGALLKLLEERRKKLAAEGLFDESRKRALPVLPTCIGVVTSPTGAVIRDILHRISDRFPRHVLVWPVKVQGEGSAAEVAAAINGFNAISADGKIPRPDVLIVARGGGSLEDLWAFNEEVVVRAAAGSKIPLISAVGHETDWTLIDHAADRRAPTPTAAAEMAVPVRLEMLARATTSGERLTQAITRYLEEGRIHLQGLIRGIPRLEEIVAQKTQALDDLSERLKRGPDLLLQRRTQDLAVLGARLNLDRFNVDLKRHGKDVQAFGDRLARGIARVRENVDHRLEAMAARLESVSPKRVLERGYAMVWDASGAPVTAAAGVATGAALRVEFADNSVDVSVTGGSPKPAKPAKRIKENPDQGSLL